MQSLDEDYDGRQGRWRLERSTDTLSFSLKHGEKTLKWFLHCNCLMKHSFILNKIAISVSDIVDEPFRQQNYICSLFYGTLTKVLGKQFQNERVYWKGEKSVPHPDHFVAIFQLHFCSHFSYFGKM